MKKKWFGNLEQLIERCQSVLTKFFPQPGTSRKESNLTQTFNTVQPLCKYNLVKQLERSVCVCVDNLLLFFIFEIKYLNHLFLLKKIYLVATRTLILTTFQLIFSPSLY